MDIEEFEKQVQPKKKRSRLAIFFTQITALKEKGYVDHQIRDWLAANGVQISRQAVQQFLKKNRTSEALNQKAKVLLKAPVSTTAKVEQRPRITNPAELREGIRRIREEVFKNS